MFKISELISKVSAKINGAKAKKVLEASAKIAKQGEALKAKAPSAKTAKSTVEKKSVVSKVSNAVFARNTAKTLEAFYSKKNLDKVLSLLESDLAATKTDLFTSKPANIGVRGELAVRENQQFISKAETLNFFSVYKEFKAQERIIAENPSFLKSKVVSKGFERLKAELGIVEQELHASYKKKYVESALSSKLSSINESSKVFVEAQKALLK
jgi:hypothetical protein